MIWVYENGTSQDYLQGMIDVILEPGYKEYRANRQLYKVGYFY